MTPMLRFTPDNIIDALHERCEVFSGYRAEDCVCDRCDAARFISLMVPVPEGKLHPSWREKPKEELLDALEFQGCVTRLLMATEHKYYNLLRNQKK